MASILSRPQCANLLLTGSPPDNDNALCDSKSVNENSVRYNMEGLYENLFTFIDTFVEIAIQNLFCWVMILHERLHSRKHKICIWICFTLIHWISFVGWDVTLRQAITRTDDAFSQRAFYKLLMTFGKIFFLSKHIFLFLLQYVTELLNV